MKKYFATLALCLSGCGLVYTAPDVSETVGDLDVHVIPLSFETIAEANLSEYIPARLPPYFRPAEATASNPLSANAGRAPQLPDVSALAAGTTRIGGADGALPPAATRPASAPSATDMKLPPAGEPQPYRIGVADVILLAANTSGATLNDVPALIAAQSSRKGYIVQDDGAIAVPDVGRVRIAGMTLEEAEAAIFDALVAQRLDPTFSLEIAEFNSQRVSVGGDVRTPTLTPITLKPLTLTESLQLAGGVAAADNQYAVVRLFRNGEVYQAPLQQLYAQNGLKDVVLRDGDSVFVDTSYDLDQARVYFEEQLRLRQAELAERQFAFQQIQADTNRAQLAATIAQFELQKAQLAQQLAQLKISVETYNAGIATRLAEDQVRQRAAFRERLELGAVKRDYAYLTGEVRQPSRFPLPFENRASLADVLFHNQGIPINNGDYSEIYVLRSEDALGGVTAYHLDASNAAAFATATAFEMRPNDIVFVAEQPITSWNRAISQMTPQIFLQGVTTSNAL